MFRVQVPWATFGGRRVEGLGLGLLVGYAFLSEGSHTRHNLLKALNQAPNLQPLKSVPSTPQPLTPHLQEPPEATNVKP